MSSAGRLRSFPSTRATRLVRFGCDSRTGGCSPTSLSRPGPYSAGRLLPGPGGGGLHPPLPRQARHVLGGPPFARPGVVPRVGRVDPDQVSADVDDLIVGLGSEVLSHAPLLAPPG